MTGLALAGFAAGREIPLHFATWSPAAVGLVALLVALVRHAAVGEAGRRADEAAHADALAAVRLHMRGWPTAARSGLMARFGGPDPASDDGQAWPPRSHREPRSHRRPPGRLAAWLAALTLLVPWRRSRARSRLVTEPQPQPAPGRHAREVMDWPTQVISVAEVRTAVATATVPVPPAAPENRRSS